MTDDLRDEQALVDRLAATIRSRILSGAIPTGARLPQEALAREFGVSRTPIREALRQLGASGVVTLEPNRGAVVRGPSASEIREAYEVRAELEGYAAELAVALIRDDELERLREAHALFGRSADALLERRGARDGVVWMRANDLFHRTIQAAAGNERLAEILAELHRTFPRHLTWSVLAESSRLLQRNVAQHGAILAAIEQHDAPGARRLMTEHVRAAGELIRRRLEQTGS